MTTRDEYAARVAKALEAYPALEACRAQRREGGITVDAVALRALLLAMPELCCGPKFRRAGPLAIDVAAASVEIALNELGDPPS